MKRSKASPYKEKKSFFGKRRQLIIFRGQYKTKVLEVRSFECMVTSKNSNGTNRVFFLTRIRRKIDQE